MAVIWSCSNQCYLDIPLSFFLTTGKLCGNNHGKGNKKKALNAWLFFRWHFSHVFFLLFFRRRKSRVKEKAEALFHRDINSMSNVCKEHTHTHTYGQSHAGGHSNSRSSGEGAGGTEPTYASCLYPAEAETFRVYCAWLAKRDEQMSHGPSCWLGVEEEESEEAVRWGIRREYVVSLSLSKRQPDTPDIVRKMNKN